VLLVDGVRMLANNVIANPTRVDLVSQVFFFCVVVATITTQEKNDLYHDRFMVDMFSPLVIELFNVYTEKRMSFFIDVRIWHEE
jgi:hypothetical protein